MEFIDRYIYAVTKRLSQKQREDIEKELRTLIDDMLEERCGGSEPQEKDIADVLNELGNPAVLAAKYRDDKSYLIGPEYFYTYMIVMKIVVIVAAMGTGIGQAIGIVVEPPQNIFEGIGELFAAVISGAFQGFTWVTVIFAVMERVNNKKFNDITKKKWNVSELPKIPKKEELIKPVDAIVGIIFAVIFMIVFCFASRFIGAYHINGDGVKIISVFSEQGMQSFMPLIIALYFVAILKECLKLIIGKWTLTLGIAITAINIVLFILSIVIFTNPSIWNGNFVNDLTASGMAPKGLNISIDTAYEGFRKGLIAIFAFAFGVDSLVAMVKGIKYSR